MKIRRITATPINFPLAAPYGWVFGELPGFSQTIVEVETDGGLVGPGVTLARDALAFCHRHYLEHGPMNKYHGPARHLPAFAAELMGAFI